MSILIISNSKDPKPWAEALRKHLPKEKIEIFPSVEKNESVEFILCWKPEKNIFKKFPNIKAVQSLGASADHIFNSNKVKENVDIARIVDPQLAEDIFEFTLAAALGHIKNFNLYNYFQKEKFWAPLHYRNIKETTVSILGLGKIGGYAAAKFAAMGFKVNGWSTTKKSIPGVKSFTGKTGMKKMFGDTDILINLLPATKKTKGILNNQTLSWLTSDAYIINIGRGEHLIEKSLLKSIEKIKIAGALLDVFNEEPLPMSHPFWVNPDIKVTPHVAALTNVDTAIGQIVENFKRMKKGKKLLNTVSSKKGY